MDMNLVNYIRIDLASPFEPPIVFKDKKAIYGYNISDGLLWIYDTENGDQLVCGIGLSNIKTMRFNEESYTSSGYSMPENFKNIPQKWKMARQEMLKNDE